MNGRKGGLDGRHMQVTLPQERSDVEDVDSQPQTDKHTNADTDLNEPGKSHPTLNIQVSASVICLSSTVFENQMPIKLFTKRPWQMLIRVVLYTGRRFACIFIVQHILKRFILPIDQVNFAFKRIRLLLYQVNVNFAFRASDCLCMRLTLQSRQQVELYR